jgi:hypothetical protein
MKKVSLFALIILIGMLQFSGSAKAQGSPEQYLYNVISAFQNCGPPQVYQSLSPQLYQQVFFQTQGSGCYLQIQQAGPIQNISLIGSQEFPVGRLFQLRVSHPNTTVDWFMGVNYVTGRIDYLNFQNLASGSPAPTIATGPKPDGGPSPPPPTASTDGCDIYPAMCE